jgi:hypothetical protein
VETLVALTLPALVIALLILGTLDLAASRRPGARRGTAVSSTGFEVLEAVFHPAKHHEIAERDSKSLLRDEHAEGAPPLSTVDLVAGTAHLVVNRPSHDTDAAAR